MNPDGIQGNHLNINLGRIRLQRGLAFGVIIITALLAFEIFNYSTTDFALTDLLGNLTFLGVRWATILAIAFCGIDFAGIARLFTPEEGAEEPGEVWYLFGAWLLAATMNAMLTWWGVSLAILNHQTLGNAVIERTTLLRIVPIFVAVLVWLIRVLIIGTFSVAGERMFSVGDQQANPRPASRNPRIPANAGMPVRSLSNHRITPTHAPAAASGYRSVPKSQPANPAKPPADPAPSHTRPEPTYHPVAMSASSNKNNSFNESRGSASNRSKHS